MATRSLPNLVLGTKLLVAAGANGHRARRFQTESDASIPMEIKKAIITAAGKSQRTLPLQSLVDRDGLTKTALRIIIEEILAAGIDEICVVVSPGDQDPFAAAAGTHAGRLHFVEQTEPRGYGHAVFCGREFV